MVPKISSFGDSSKIAPLPLSIPQPPKSTQEDRRLPGESAAPLGEVAAIAPCPKCNSTEIDLVPMPANSPHHAKRVCACGAFRGWEPRPENKQKQQQQQTRIAALLQSPQLPLWEREFLESVQGKRSLSPKQQQVLSHLEAKLEVQG